jgi:transglutaminase-like putative cysteine protease
VIPEDSLLKARDFHNWAEVYIDNQWRVVDPQHKKFLETEHYYVAMRVLSNQGKSSISNTHGFSYADERLDLKMN